MAAGDFLSIDSGSGAVAVPVAMESGNPREVPVEVGERGRAFSGMMRSSVRAYSIDWPDVDTKWIPETEAATLRSMMEGTPPLEATGEMVGGVATDVHFSGVHYSNRKKMLAADGTVTDYVVLTFTMHQEAAA